jgi:hypothetical protein
MGGAPVAEGEDPNNKTMNKDTRTIMQLLGVSEQTALKIQSKMGENGLDFSECHQREFNRVAREAYRQILQPDEH